MLILIVIVTALAFDFTNGFHDTANAMATSIASGALRPKIAVGLAAVLNLAGAFLAVEVAKTISNGIVDDTLITPAIIFGGLVGAILWNLITWLFSLPSSSSHALIGGLIGATWVGAGGDAVRFAVIVEKVIIPALASPLIAGVAAAAGTYLVYRITRTGKARTINTGFRRGQLVSASAVSLAHGTNDAQKTMGVITLTLIASGHLASGSGPPWWVILSAGGSIALGTYLGGWRIIRTVGHRLTHIEAPQGFAAETAGATVILASSHLGYALSTTQVVSGAVVGSGMARRERVRWRVVGRMVVAWVLTLPAAGVMGAGAGWIADQGTAGVITVAALGIIAATVIYLTSRRDPVSAATVNDPPATEVPLPAPAVVG